MDFSITFDTAAMENIQGLLTGLEHESPKIMTRAITKTIKRVKTKGAKLVGEQLNMPAKTIKEDFDADFPTYTNVNGNVRVASRPHGLLSFYNTKPLTTGVRYRIFKGEPLITKEGAFIATSKGAKNVFIREHRLKHKRITGKYFRRFKQNKNKLNRYRLGIDRRVGPRISSIFFTPRVFDPVQKLAQEHLIEKVKAEIKVIYRGF